MDVKCRDDDEMDIVSVIEDMAKFGENFENSEVGDANSAFGFGSNSNNININATPTPIFASFNTNILPPYTLSINNPTHSVPPYSAAPRWITHPNSAMGEDEERESMREMIYRMAAMQPIEIDPQALKPPKRRNVKISKDPQSVAARHRRERISERIRILQTIVPGGTKMDTASMLDEAIHYLKFLKNQLQIAAANNNNNRPFTISAATNYKHFHFGHRHLEDAN